MTRAVLEHSRESRGGRAGSRRAFRYDVEGLRALAIVLVVVDHAFNWPAGGFIGVDVFFVISGFLITGLLLKEHERDGRISFSAFYRRRIRRIIPASWLVVAVTVAASGTIYLATRFHQIVGDAVWTVLFAANWRFAAQGVDYFASTQEPSPLQHYWSLAVEEQYYLVWPLLLLLALTLGSRVGNSRRTATVVASVLLVVGFAWSLVGTATDPTVAYFSTFTRMWELMAGSLLALLAGRLTGLPGWSRPWLQWGGLVAVIAAAFLIRPDSAFPAPGALLPVLGTVAVIAGGTDSRRSSTFVPLTNPVARYLGRISYSLYLWHWPALILIGAALPGTGLGAVLIALAAALGLSVLSFHFVEDPIRRSGWLEPRSARRARVPKPQPRKPVALIAGACALLVGAAGTGVIMDRAARSDASAAVPAPAPATTAPASDADSAIRNGVVAALSATRWPAGLHPALADVGTSAPPELTESCVNDWDTVKKSCTYGSDSAPKTVMVVGDSTAISWLPALRKTFAPDEWRIVSFGKYGCPAASISVRGPGGAANAGCDVHRRWVLDQVQTLHPDVVIVGEAEGYIDTLPGGQSGRAAMDRWKAALGETLGKIAAGAPNAEIHVLSAPPAAPNVASCATARSVPADCEARIAPAWHHTSTAEQEAVAQAQAAGARVDYIDTHEWVCADERCPAFASGILIRSDLNHFTQAYSEFLATGLIERLHPDTQANK